VTVEPGSPKTEQMPVNVFLTNRRSQACILDGYPMITLFDRQGRALSYLYRHAGDQMVTSARPRTVRIRAGGTAVFVFNKNECVLTPAAEQRRAALTLRVALPGSRQTQAVRMPRRWYFEYCGGRDMGRIITVSPIEPSLSAASAGR
jgi:Domain of unknown function (DUF4232)